MANVGRIRGNQIKDESVESIDIASGSIRAGELSEEAISGQTLITTTDPTNDRLLIWDATDSALKKVAPGNLGVGGGGGGGTPAGANTQIQFNDGGSSFGASSNFTWDDTKLKVSGVGTSTIFQLETSENSSTASPVLELTRVSSTAADADYLGQIKWVGNNDQNASTVYAKVTGKIDDASVGTEDGILEFANMRAGSQTITARLRSDSLQLLNSTNLVVDGTAEISGFLYHKDDNDTFIKFEDDDINFQAGGVNFIDITQGGTNEITFNEAGADVDFRVEGDNNPHLFYIDGGNDKIGIGTSTPQVTLHVHADSINDGAVTISQSDNSGDASQLDLSKSRGTGASPAALANGDFIGQIRMLGFNGSDYGNFADIFGQAAGAISNTSHPTQLIIRTTQVNATSPTTAVTIDENQGMTVAGSIYGKMRHMTHHRYNDGSGTGREWIPWVGTSEQASPSYITQGVAPYNGKLVKVLVRSSKSGGLGNTSVGVHIGTDGSTVVNTSAEETVEANMSSANTSYSFNFTAGNHFAAGDIIGVAIDPTNAHGNVNVTCVWEYEITA